MMELLLESPFTCATPQRTPLWAIAHTKRFIERYLGDASFRNLLETDAGLVMGLHRCNLEIPLEDARAYLRVMQTGDLSHETDALRDLRRFRLEANRAEAIMTRSNGSTHLRYSAWRKRQLGSLRFHLSSLSDFVVRPVVAFELSLGCSVGCWFCAVGAEKLQEHFLATEHNCALFRSTQLAFRNLLGESAGSAMCYWATDPLDNPDYEIFTLDFHAIHGIFPPTTTALGGKAPERTRALLKMAESRETWLNRFSVLSLGMLNRLHEVFSAEELLNTEMVFQMPQALVAIDSTRNEQARKIRSGRARSLPSDDPRVYSQDAGTVACVIGFLVNFLERTIHLVAPCIPSDRWPLGYVTHATGSGFTTETVEQVLAELIEKNIPTGLQTGTLRVDAAIQLDASAEMLHLHTPLHSVYVSVPGAGQAALQRLVDMLHSAHHSAMEILSAMRSEGLSLLQTQALLERLWTEGVLEG